MDIQIKRGLLEACVLTALASGDSYGYKIIRDISPYIEISESTLYPILRRLEAGKFVEARSVEHNGRLRKYYRITDDGHRRIGEFKEEWKEVMKVIRFIMGGGENE